MFLVRDTRSVRTRKILSYAESDIAVSVILAAMDFEWSCRRAILALGRSTTEELKSESGLLFRCSGLENYKKAWNKEVYPGTGDRLQEVIPDWEYFREQAFPLRHRLVHGVAGTTGRRYATPRIDSMLNASAALADYAANHGTPIFGGRIDRRKAR